MAFSLSVIVPNFNDARFLPMALDALLSQSEPAQEIFVVDDASSDQSPEIIESYARRYPVIRPVIRPRTQGVVATMNQFAREATREFVYFAAADDFVLPGYFATARSLLEKSPRAGLCSALCRVVDAAGNDLGLFSSPIPQTDSFGYIAPERGRELLLRHDSWVKGNTAIYRREAVVAEGGFRPELHGFSDGFMHRLMILEYGVCFVPVPFVCLRQREGSVSDRTNTDEAKLSDVITVGAELMGNDPKHRFLAKYIARWRQRTLFGAARTMLGRNLFSSGSLEALGLTRLDHAIVKTLLALRAQRFSQVYLFLRMRPYDLMSMARRRLHYWQIESIPNMPQHKNTKLGVGASDAGKSP